MEKLSFVVYRPSEKDEPIAIPVDKANSDLLVRAFYHQNALGVFAPDAMSAIATFTAREMTARNTANDPGIPADTLYHPGMFDYGPPRTLTPEAVRDRLRIA